MKTLPENILKLSEQNEVVQNKTTDIIGRVVAKFKIQKVDEEFSQKTPEEVVTDFFLVAFNAKEGETPTVPQGYEKYENAFSKIVSIVEAHKKAESSAKEKKALEDEAKKQQKEAAKAAREEEDKFFVAQDTAFQTTLISSLEKVKDPATSALSALQKSIKLPKNISFAKEGQGLVFGENVTPEDIAAATAGVIAGFEGQQSAEGLLQFAIGDIINKSVEAKTYRSKADAQSAIALVVTEKAKRSYAPGSLAQYATMAARIPLEARKPGVSPSLYLQASKAVVPRDKNIKGDELTKLEASFEESRAELVEQINEGKLSTVKEVQEATKKVVENLGVAKKEGAGELKKAKDQSVKDFFYWLFIKNELVGKHKEGVAVLKLSDGKTVEVPLDEIAANLSASYVKAKELNIANLANVVVGKHTVTGADKKEKEEPFYMPYPFEVKKKEEPKAPEAPAAEAPATEQPAKEEAPVAEEKAQEEAPEVEASGEDDDIDI